MTTIIKIDRSTVKRNPRAGATQSHVFNGETILFDYAVVKKEYFDKLKSLESEDRCIHITKWGQLTGSNLFSASGILESVTAIGKLPQEGLIIGIEKHVQAVNHLPESFFLFSYELTKVACSQCKSMVSVSTIESDEDYHGNYFEFCPVCEYTNTFDYKYEDIYTVAKELNL